MARDSRADKHIRMCGRLGSEANIDSIIFIFDLALTKRDCFSITRTKMAKIHFTSIMISNMKCFSIAKPFNP